MPDEELNTGEVLVKAAFYLFVIGCALLFIDIISISVHPERMEFTNKTFDVVAIDFLDGRFVYLDEDKNIINVEWINHGQGIDDVEIVFSNESFVTVETRHINKSYLPDTKRYILYVNTTEL